MNTFYLIFLIYYIVFGLLFLYFYLFIYKQKKMEIKDL